MVCGCFVVVVVVVVIVSNSCRRTMYFFSLTVETLLVCNPCVRCLKDFLFNFFFGRLLPWALLTSILMRHCQHCVSVRWPSLSSHRAILVSNEFSEYTHNTIAQPEPFTICKPFPRVFSYAFTDAWEKPGKDVDAIHTNFPPTRPWWKCS